MTNYEEDEEASSSEMSIENIDEDRAMSEESSTIGGTSNNKIDKLNKLDGDRNKVEKKLTIDSSNQKVIEKEKRFWRDVLKRIISVVKMLANRNLAFRGSNEKFDDHNSGNFLSMIQMIADFDPIIEEHLRRIRRKEIRRVRYHSHNIQNELILLLLGEIKNKILEIIKEAKYFSVILDYTPDISHEEQMSLILRCVNISKTLITVEELFIQFLKVAETSGDALYNELKSILGILELDFNDMREQGYDNGSNMKRQYKGKVNKVSKILQRKNIAIDDGISLLKGLIIFLEEYRNTGFEAAKSEAEKIALRMEVEPIFRETCIRRRKTFFDANSQDEPI
ncbi:uncharacterized protein LOC122054987 [Zingiber officinale]|uniref:uncharacterized protein LOC122054987 n=1 Tax=Zingiber officinale TaxID=94328 RepID=UPI001C4AAEBE|nr:uncharacterized protein LOC122054987 [Zingiber officinale]